MLKNSKKAIIHNVFLKGKNICYGEVCVRFLANETTKTQFLFICGKKSIPLAVSRNKIKRWMRESVREIKEGVVSGMDVVFVFRGRTASSLHKTREDIKKVLQASNLLK